MKFTYLGATYEIEFQRQRRERARGGLTTYPATTVRLIRSEAGKLPGELVREATVGYSVTNENRKFTLEGGRISALRAITPTLDKDLRRVLWGAYVNRKAKV